MEKKIKQLINNIKHFESYHMNEVRKWVDKNEPEHLMLQIEGAYSRLERWEKEYKEITSTYPEADLAEQEIILKNTRAELDRHKLKCEEELNNLQYIHEMSRELLKMASYFSFQGGYSHNLDLELTKKDFSFTDTEKLLATESDDYNLRESKEKYEISLNNLNNDDYIDGYYDFIDEKLQYETDKEGVASKFYGLFSLLQECLFPENDNLNDLLFYLNKLRGKAQDNKNEELNKVIVSDFHANHINEVFFTDKERLPVAELTANDMKTRFQPGETIRCIAFLDNSFQNIYGKHSRSHFEVNITGYNWCLDAEEFTEDDLSKGYIDFKLATDAKDYHLPETASWSSVEKIMNAMLSLPSRPKTIEVFVKSDGNDRGEFPQAELVGKFKIDGGDEDGLIQLKRNLKVVKAVTLESERIAEPSMNDHQLEQEILDFFNQLNWNEVFKKAIITSDNFFAVKNNEGIAIARGLYVTMLSETEDSCFQQEFTVAQDQLGDSWSGFRLEGTGSKSEISCNKVN